MCYSILMETSLDKLAKELRAQPDEAEFAAYRALMQAEPGRFKDMSLHPRIYPFYFAPVVFQRDEARVIAPMRYRLRPSDSREEPPAKYNLYNARLEAIGERQNWRRLFMRQHGVIMFRAFFEWITAPDGKKRVVQFTPADDVPLCAPVLYDHWQAVEGQEAYFSFAVITTEPPEEVRAAGHDRCPVILKSGDMDTWLSPAASGVSAVQKILHSPAPVKFICDAASNSPK